MALKRFAYAGMALALLLASCAQQEQQQAARAPVPVKVAKVTKGNIQSTLSYSGELQPLDQVDIVPSSSGRLQEVFVEEGATVLAGTPLGQLETDTLQAQVRQAEASLLSARSRLETVLRGARPEEIAIAQAQLETQRSRLRALEGAGGAGSIATARANLSAAAAALANAQAKLDQLLNPTPVDIAVAQAALAAATSNFNKAQATYDQLRNPTSSDIAAAETAVDSARATLRSTEAKLDDLVHAPKEADVAAARATVAAAEATLKKAEETYTTYRTPLAKESVRKLLDALNTANNARAKLARDRAAGADDSVIIADEQALSIALRALQIAENEAGTYRPGVTAEEIASARASVESAQASLTSAQAKLDLLLAGTTTADLRAAQAAVDAARTNLTNAEIKLERLKNPMAADIFTAQAAVDAARSQQVTAQRTLDDLRNPRPTDYQTAVSAVENTTSGRAAAEAAVSRAEADLQAQEAAVAQAEQQLNLVVDKYTSPDIAAATAAVAQAAAATDLTRIQLSKATLVAPFDAIVAKKNVSVGATISSQTVVFTLVSQSLQAVFNSEEASLGRLRPGLAVSLTVAAFGERAFKAAVTSIAPVADSTSRTFRIKAIPAASQDGLRAGMFASIVVTTESRDGVLLIPQEALVQRGQDTLVFVVKDNVAEQRKIEVGLRNDRSVQVRSGLEESEEVVVQGNRTLRQQDSVTVIK